MALMCYSAEARRAVIYDGGKAYTIFAPAGMLTEAGLGFRVEVYMRGAPVTKIDAGEYPYTRAVGKFVLESGKSSVLIYINCILDTCHSADLRGRAAALLADYLANDEHWDFAQEYVRAHRPKGDTSIAASGRVAELLKLIRRQQTL